MAPTPTLEARVSNMNLFVKSGLCSTWVEHRRALSFLTATSHSVDHLTILAGFSMLGPWIGWQLMHSPEETCNDILSAPRMITLLSLELEWETTQLPWLWTPLDGLRLLQSCAPNIGTSSFWIGTKYWNFIIPNCYFLVLVVNPTWCIWTIISL